MHLACPHHRLAKRSFDKPLQTSDAYWRRLCGGGYKRKYAEYSTQGILDGAGKLAEVLAISPLAAQEMKLD